MRIYEVNNCSECYLQRNAERCSLENRFIYPRDFNKSPYFPDWCPLEEDVLPVKDWKPTAIIGKRDEFDE